MNLPSNEYTFSFKTTGDKTKKVFEGSFTVKCLLTSAEIIEVGLRLDQYNRGSKTLAPGVNLLNRAFAELDVRMIKAPSWWKDSQDGRDLFDTNVVLEVFDRAIEAEAVYDKRVAEAADVAEKAAEESQKKKAAK